MIGDGTCQGFNKFSSCGNYDGGDCCLKSMINDGICQDFNNVSSCNFDGGDCCQASTYGDTVCDDHNNFFTCGNYDKGDCRPPQRDDWKDCPYNPDFIGDGICQEHFKTNSCNHDGGDCCEISLVGDRFCNEINNFANCSMFDGGDCRAQ